MTPRKHSSVTQEVDAVLGPAPAAYAQPEVIVLRFRRHGSRLVLPVIALVAVAAAAGYWVGSFGDSWLDLTAAAVAAALAFLLGLMPILTWLAGTTTVSTRRVIVRRGLFVRSRSELPLSRVREVRTRRSPLQRILGAGDVLLFHGAETLRLESVPAATKLADALQDLMERNFAQAERAERAAFGQPLPGVGVAQTGGVGFGGAPQSGVGPSPAPIGPDDATRVQGFMDL